MIGGLEQLVANDTLSAMTDEVLLAFEKRKNSYELAK